jgi:hypothetical protein
MTQADITKTLAACRKRAWDDDTDDRSRVVIWDAYDLLRHMRRELRDRDARLVRQAALLERVERDVEILRRAKYGPQKGGAA